MPPKILSSLQKGQKNLFSFFIKPTVTNSFDDENKINIVESSTIDNSIGRILKESKRPIDSVLPSTTGSLNVVIDVDGNKRRRRNVIYDEDDVEDIHSHNLDIPNFNHHSPEDLVDNKHSDSSFLIESSEDDQNSTDDLFNSDSEEEINKKKVNRNKSLTHTSKLKKKTVAITPLTITVQKEEDLSRNKPREKSTHVFIPHNEELLDCSTKKHDHKVITIGGGGKALITPKLCRSSDHQSAVSSSLISPFFRSNSSNNISPEDNLVKGLTSSLITPNSPCHNNINNNNTINTSTYNSTNKIILPEGVVGRGSHEHNSFPFLLPKNRKDINSYSMNHPLYNHRTLFIPDNILQEQTPAMAQWWHFKSFNMDTVLFFKVGKFYELFHMDADVGFSELDLIYMKGTKAHSGFPEVSYGKFASALVVKGYRVARVEQTETPEMLKDRNDCAGKGIKKDKVVARELCSIMSKGTRTYCHLDDLSLLDETSDINSNNNALNSSLLLCIKESITYLEEDFKDTTAADTVGNNVSSDLDTNKAQHMISEYGICCIDTVLGVITVAQFQDDKQRSRLRTLLARYQPSEVLLEHNHYSDFTMGAIQLLAPKASLEYLKSNSEMPTDGNTIITTLNKGQYFNHSYLEKGSNSNTTIEIGLKGWPPVLKAVHAGMQDKSSELVLCAIGGALWQLKRSLIDYEILSLGKVLAYIPSDEQQQRLNHLENNSSNDNNNNSSIVQDNHEIANSTSTSASQCTTQSSTLFSNIDIDYRDSVFDHLHHDEEPTVNLEDNNDGIKTMTLDEVALTNLEILVNNYDRTEKGSLWSFLNHCKTASGRRLLKSWVCHPLYRCSDIKRRQNAIEELLSSNLSEPCHQAKNILKNIPDLERLLARVHSNGLKQKGPNEHPDQKAIMYENYNIRKIKDFADILTGFELVCRVITIFESITLQSTLLKLCMKSNKLNCGRFPYTEMKGLLSYFREIFDEKQAKKEGHIHPKSGINQGYDQAKSDIQHYEQEFEKYLKDMKTKIGIHDLKYFGSHKDRFQIEIPLALCHKVPNDWVTKSQKKTHRRYWNKFIESKLHDLMHAEERLVAAQKDTLRHVFEKFDQSRNIWSDGISCISLIDALLSLTIVSSFPGYSRPNVFVSSKDNHNDSELNIIGGRHPMLEYRLLQRGDGDCIANNLSLGGSSEVLINGNEQVHFNPKMLLLSGPNMGGKSTLLRQTCLIVILAQIGCWVPAESCHLTPVDRIYTRVGATDRILAGQSTFFVELAETAMILNTATKNSLCILDELGRGTATFDGTAIAHAVVEHLVSFKHCRVLFATHYHSLIKDWEFDPRVKLGHMDCLVHNTTSTNEDCDNINIVKDNSEEVTFLYKLSDGCSPRSYGINVARLAGLPQAVITLALEQSRVFEERMSCFSTNKQSSNHSIISNIFERLSSLVNSTSNVEELSYAAIEMWNKLQIMKSNI